MLSMDQQPRHSSGHGVCPSKCAFEGAAQLDHGLHESFVAILVDSEPRPILEIVQTKVGLTTVVAAEPPAPDGTRTRCIDECSFRLRDGRFRSERVLQDHCRY